METAETTPELYSTMLTVYHRHVPDKPKVDDLGRLEQGLHEVIRRTVALAQSDANPIKIFEQENVLRRQRNRLLNNIDRLLVIR